MSTDADELILRTRAPGLRRSAIGFICLLLLALLWPAPVVWLNELTLDLSLEVDERSFLGREAPAWDVVFWGIAGTFALALLHGRIDQAQESLRQLGPDLRDVRTNAAAQWHALGWRHLLVMGTAVAAVAVVWQSCDAALIANAERVEDEGLRTMVRLANRLGGGMNPTMIIIFFAFAGILFSHRRWVLFALAMILAGLAGGVIIHLLKLVVARSRPELWLGPFDHSGPLASSFPSGHTVSAFAIASVLLFGSRALWLRIISVLLATAIAGSRVLSFRHWPSDVLASAFIGLLLGWFFVSAIRRNEA